MTASVAIHILEIICVEENKTPFSRLCVLFAGLLKMSKCVVPLNKKIFTVLLFSVAHERQTLLNYKNQQQKTFE